VPLTTQGDNSRIRCSLSQECQHVFSSDFRPYNNKLLGTAPALQQEVALPANFMIRSISSAAHAIGVSIDVIMAWGLWKFLASALLYIHLLTRFNLPQAPLVRQATPTAVSSSIDLSDAFEVLLEFDD
jgi:hypothetical protein